MFSYENWLILVIVNIGICRITMQIMKTSYLNPFAYLSISYKLINNEKKPEN